MREAEGVRAVAPTFAHGHRFVSPACALVDPTGAAQQQHHGSQVLTSSSSSSPLAPSGSTSAAPAPSKAGIPVFVYTTLAELPPRLRRRPLSDAEALAVMVTFAERGAERGRSVGKAGGTGARVG